MQPEIEILGLSLKTFGLFFALNFVAWGLVVSRRLREIGKPPDWAYEMVFAAMLGGLVGARLYWLLDHPGEFGEDPLGSLLGGAGLTWYGGLAGGAVAVVVWARRRGFLGLPLLDVSAIGLALGYAVGRIGCQISGDGDYGEASGLPWAMAYPDGVVPTTEEVHPTPVYETLAMGMVAWVLWRLRDVVRPGGLFALYLVLAGLERFLVEFVRRNDAVAAGLTMAQWQSLALLAAGLVWVAVLVRRGGLRLPAARPVAAAA